MKTMSVEYEVWVWENDGLVVYVATEDYDTAVETCKELTSKGVEYEAYKVTNELLDI